VLFDAVPIHPCEPQFFPLLGGPRVKLKV